MNGNDQERHGYDPAALDELLDSAMNGILGKLEAGFDPEAGLGDISTRRTSDEFHHCACGALAEEGSHVCRKCLNRARWARRKTKRRNGAKHHNRKYGRR